MVSGLFLFAMTDAEHAELAQAVQMLRDAGYERAAFLLGRAWHDEIEKAKKRRKRRDRSGEVDALRVDIGAQQGE
jgi:hypothetical protein